MKVAILSANLGNFDTNISEPVKQDLPEGVEVVFHRFTDKDFPPIADLPSRFQYRIPKMFGWQMFPGYDIYIWMDGGMNLERSDSVKWLLDQLGEADIAFFKHPWRKTVKEEVDHIEQKLKEGNEYITSRYKNGLHKEQYELAISFPDFIDNTLYASTAFIYRFNLEAINLLTAWWGFQARYYTCDQVNLPYALFNRQEEVNVKTINEDVFKNPYVTIVSKHK